MTSLFLIPLLFSGATHVWTASSLDDIGPGLEAPFPRSAEVRLVAARGEWESFQICLRATGGALEGVTVEPAPLQGVIPAPVLWRVGFLQAGGDGGELVPDPLLPLVPFDVPGGETRAVWASYRVPEDASPGTYRGALRVRWGRRAYRDVTVTLSVPDITLPQASGVAALVDVDAAALEEVLGLSALDVEAWDALYSVLGSYRMAPRLTGVSLPPSALKRHLRQAGAHAALPVADLGQAGHQPEAFPLPLLGVIQDPLQIYLHDMLGWMEHEIRGARPVMVVTAATDRRDWLAAREHLFRVRRADDRVARVIQAPLHPYFERYANVLAASFPQAHPVAVDRLAKGRSLTAADPIPVTDAAASSAGAAPAWGYATVPMDASDGSLFTGWYSGALPSVAAPQWIEITYAELTIVDEITIWWPRGYEGLSVEVQTSAEGRVFSPATTEWVHRLGEAPDLASQSLGRFKVRKPMRAVRFRFRQPSAAGPVAILEVVPGPEREQMASANLSPVAVWLDAGAGAFPSLDAPGAGAAARLVPWICWHHGLGGFLGAGVAAWPRTWKPLVSVGPAVWPIPAGTRAPLFYPVPDGIVPSVRAERLRDGIEDHAWLTIGEAAGLVERRPVLDDPESVDAGEWARRIQRQRDELGRALAR